jgi:NADPH:quinone reductase
VKAIVVREFGEPEVMKVQEVATPVAGPGQVVVRIKAAGVNPADTYVRSGNAQKPPLPYTPGSDGAGLIETVASGVKSVKPGDRVYCARTVSGSYAEYALAEESMVYPLPGRVSFSQGAGVFVPYATVHHALFHVAKARPGEIVFVHGASGGVGVAAVQTARSHGLTVIGTGGTDRGRELALREGAHHVLDHHAAGYQEKVLALTGGRGVDVILEMLANVNLSADLKLLAPHGRVVVIGSRGDVTINPREMMGKETAILAMILWNITEGESKAIHAALGAGLDNGTLRPVVGVEMPLADAPKAHRKVLEPGAYGKIVLLP